MSNLLYLLAVIGLSVLGTTILWYRHRKPRSLESGIHEFNRELRALSPERPPSDRPRRG